MTDATAAIQQPLFQDTPIAELGSIGIRVVVLPPKDKKGSGDGKATEAVAPADLDPDEYLADVGATPLSSYLESSKGKRCCVFLVNGQRQESLDNSFIVQELGFKYLRNRMMVAVDVDGLAPEAIGRLMQGSRQGFYRGDIWNAIIRRIIATLKDDPDLLRLEEEAEQQVADLKAGDEKVREALDQLIEAHHEHGWNFAEGTGTSGEHRGDDLGSNTVTKDGVVSLLPLDKGQAADYPVLLSQPTSSSIRLRPNEAREVNITALPSHHWQTLAQFTASGDSTVKELSVQLEKLPDEGKLTLCFKEPDRFDRDQYPVRALVRVTARFNGIKEPRQLSFQVVVKPDQPQPNPILHDEPTQLKISSREPVKIRRGETDAHVRLRWDGKDYLVTSEPAAWRFSARLVNADRAQPTFNFSQPILGRFSLLISPRPEWQAGDQMEFEVTASSEAGRQLTVTFAGEVVEPQTEDEPEEKKPRLVDGELVVGARRRPPYKLIYITRDEYEGKPCWGGKPWSDAVPGYFIEPTDRTPLFLVINVDMDALCEYKRGLTKKNTEQVVERKVNKYTSHIGYHLYQMYQASQAQKKEEAGNLDLADMRRRDEIRRVSMTLINLMDVG
jgi:hypothetical protein